ncbi:MAG: hypothetical protein ABI675_08630 [Chitinophagaceae bacterium]
MNKTEILVTGKNELTAGAVIALINTNPEWVATKAATDEEAIEKFHQRDFDLVLFADGTTEEEERKLRKVFTIQNPDIAIIKHKCDDESVLTAKIMAALDTQKNDKKPSFSFIDDALKNSGLNIVVQ